MPGFREMLKDQRAQSEWSSVYMLVILIIAALLLITVIKPMFRQSQQVVKQTTPKPS
jgi:competence protein ComGC